MIRRPPRSTLDRSSAASDVYKRQAQGNISLPGADPLGAAVWPFMCPDMDTDDWSGGRYQGTGALNVHAASPTGLLAGFCDCFTLPVLSLIHISEPTRPY